MFWEYSKLILIEIGVGLVLMIGAFSKKSSAVRWAKRILFFAGLSGLISGVLGMIKIYYSSTMTARHLNLLAHYKTLLGGLTLGFLITLFASGELSKKKWSKPKSKNNEETKSNNITINE
ncbi:MAG: hypothetical protein HZC48_02815 [Nitrospirae bacterium]|nr:hypothetical protein [Nitrospirota bacterium]